MIPDAPLFFPLFDYAQTHSFLGVFSVCMPLGVSFFLLFEMVCRRPLLALSPTWFQLRLPASPQIPSVPKLHVQISFYFVVACSVVLGALSHQFWDAFTHEGRWGTELVPALNSTYTILGRPIGGYKLLQYGSTLVGLPVLVILAWNYLRGLEPRHNQLLTVNKKCKWSAALVCTLTPAVLAIYSFVTQPNIYQAAGATIKTSGATIAILAIVYSIGHQITIQNSDA